jgi:RNA polymerase sigma-70 factor (ECF subfamily)
MSEPEHRERKTRSGPSSGSFKVARVEVQELAALAGPDVFSSPGADLLSDELLVDRVLSGDPLHYDVLVRRTGARVFRIARGILGKSERAEEVMLSTFVFAYENLGSYDRRLRFGDWLSRIAIHGSLAALKRESTPPLRERARQPSELVRQLEDAVDGLPQKFRVPFALCVLDEMFPKDVAETLGITPEAVRVGSFRGRLQVRRALGTRFDDVESRAFGLDLTTADEILRRVRQRLGFAQR